jgi:hypothetical protein
MVPGLASVVKTVTGRLVTELCPQPLMALTVTFPEVALVVTEIELLVELPDHPEGKVQT